MTLTYLTTTKAGQINQDRISARVRPLIGPASLVGIRVVTI